MRDFLDEYPEHRDLEVTDVEIGVDPNTKIQVRNFAGEVEKRTAASLMGLDVLNNWEEVAQQIHPHGSRRYRHFPLEFLLWAERRLSGGGVVEPELMSEMPSLDELRDLLEAGRRPVTILPPGATQDVSGGWGSLKAHNNAAVDAYWMVTHDLYHLRRWNQFGPELGSALRQDMVYIYDSLKRALGAYPQSVQENYKIHEAQDQILSGPGFRDESSGNYQRVFSNLNLFFKEGLEPHLKDELVMAFRRHLAAELKDPPRREKILGEFDVGFQVPRSLSADFVALSRAEIDALVLCLIRGDEQARAILEEQASGYRYAFDKLAQIDLVDDGRITFLENFLKENDGKPEDLAAEKGSALARTQPSDKEKAERKERVEFTDRVKFSPEEESLAEKARSMTPEEMTKFLDENPLDWTWNRRIQWVHRFSLTPALKWLWKTSLNPPNLPFNFDAHADVAILA
ncbi:MAG: hypothetical protein ACREP8_07750, partial [Candidatus Binatia bacterium]